MARMKVAKNIAYDDDRRRYYVTFHYGNGVKSTKTFTTKADAVRALKQFEADKANEEVVEPTRDSLGEWMRYWLENISKPNVRATTYHGYKNLVERHLIPSLGGKPLQKITAADIREYYKKKLSGPKALSQNSLRKHHDVLNQIFQAAVLEDKLRKNPMRIVSAPKKETIQYTIYTAEELHDLFEKVKGNRLEIVVKLAGYYGLRREEICGLKWQDIDFERNLFEIRRSMTMAGGQLLIDEPKTKSSYRKEAMNDDVRELLLRLRDRQEENKRMLKDDYVDTGFILCWEDGKPYRPNYISELFAKFLLDNGLKKIRLHDLRHSFASIANDLGVPMFNISKALGHGSTAVTSGIYTHMFDDSHKETIDRVTEAIQQFKKTGKAT